MTTDPLSPNELAELYDALFAVLENLPEATHPAWKLAIESVIFGGEGLAPDATNYGEQQTERNEFKISEYREQYGDGERVTEFATLAVDSPREADAQHVDDTVQLPVAPDSAEVLPLFVGEDDLAEAILLLNEFPPEPGADRPGEGVPGLVDDSKFPSLTTTTRQGATGTQESRTESSENGDLPPNELADLYDGIRLVLNHLPEDVHPVWADAIETMIFGGEALAAGATPYGEQQAERNRFGMPEYRATFGNGATVTTFPTLSTARPAERDRPLVDEDVRVPIAPESNVPLPLNPDARDLDAAVSLLSEFPAEPQADVPGDGTTRLIDVAQLRSRIDTDATQHAEPGPEPEHSVPTDESGEQIPETPQKESDTSVSRRAEQEGLREATDPGASGY